MKSRMRAHHSALFAVFLGLFACVYSPLAYAQTDAQAEAIAQERFTRGRALFEEGDFAGAAEELRQAAALSDSPNVKLYLARAYREMHRYAEAITAYQSAERLAAEAGPRRRRYRETAEAARLEREELEATLARVTITVRPMPQGLTFTLDGEAVPVEALGIPYPVASGGHVARFEAPGHEPLVLHLELGPGSEDEQTIHLLRRPEAPPIPVAPPAESHLSFLGPVVMGVGAALMLGASPAFVVANDRFSQLRSGCPMGQCPEALRGVMDEGRTMESLSIGLLTSGVVVLAIGGVVLALDLGDVVDF